MIPSRPALVALCLVACGEVAPVSLSRDAGVSLWSDEVPMTGLPFVASADGSAARRDAALNDSTAGELADAGDATTDVAPHVCSGVYPIAFSCLTDMPGCSPCVEGVTCCQLDAY